MYSNRYTHRLNNFNDWEIIVLQQTQLNAVNPQFEGQHQEIKIDITVRFKPYSLCTDGSKMTLMPSYLNDIVSRMYRRAHKLATKNPCRNAENSNNSFVPSISGYCNTQQQPYASLTLGVPSNFGRLEFAGLIESVLMECPFVENCTLTVKVDA